MSKYIQEKENNIEVVRVIWVDAFSASGAWWNESEVPDEVPQEAYNTSVGFLVKDTEDGVWLTMGTGDDGRILAPFFIPKAMLKEMETINV